MASHLFYTASWQAADRARGARPSLYHYASATQATLLAPLHGPPPEMGNLARISRLSSLLAMGADISLFPSERRGRGTLAGCCTPASYWHNPSLFSPQHPSDCPAFH